MQQNEITVLAKLKVQHGQENFFRQEMFKVIPITRKEKGALTYILHVSSEQATDFIVYEKWVTKADLDAHLNAPHMQEFFKNIKPILAEEPEITIYNELNPLS